jgi:hypothetical protein
MHFYVGDWMRCTEAVGVSGCLIVLVNQQLCPFIVFHVCFWHSLKTQTAVSAMPWHCQGDFFVINTTPILTSNKHGGPGTGTYCSPFFRTVTKTGDFCPTKNAIKTPIAVSLTAIPLRIHICAQLFNEVCVMLITSPIFVR